MILSLLYYTTKGWLLGLSSLTLVHVETWVSPLLLTQKLDKNSYISIIEICCMGLRKKREERVLLVISSVEINILLLFLLL